MPQSISNQYQKVLTLALQLPPTERIAMIAELAASVTEIMASSSGATTVDEAALSPDEVADLMTVQPLSPVEIVKQGLLGSWSDLGISDGSEWVEQQKHRRKEARKWQMAL
ncbi:MAG: hypothetical protein KF893_04375 [Caldilineaceae bacterium]|nr:hypothetical protein [Caldilineaceae bacterium]